uniref:Uncharacterized protein n=1 Tax=Anguilla anguilla TaxID=7936 RepID=A0A0E9TH39_ANGAN
MTWGRSGKTDVQNAVVPQGSGQGGRDGTLTYDSHTALLQSSFQSHRWQCSALAALAQVLRSRNMWLLWGNQEMSTSLSGEMEGIRAEGTVSGGRTRSCCGRCSCL